MGAHLSLRKDHVSETYFISALMETMWLNIEQGRMHTLLNGAYVIVLEFCKENEGRRREPAAPSSRTGAKQDKPPSFGKFGTTLAVQVLETTSLNEPRKRRLVMADAQQYCHAHGL
jgi:hypothetical protein